MFKKFFKNVFSIKPDALPEKRIELIDFLRGGAMILVLLHHSGFTKGHYISAFHMPLFFIISGYTQRISGGYKKSFTAYIKSRFFRLMIPYFLFELLNMLLWFINCTYFSSLDFSLTDCLYSIATCVNTEYVGIYGRLWFLPCMFFADIYVKLILQYWDNKRTSLVSFTLLLFGISYAITTFCPCRLPMTIDTAFMAAAFILIGHLSADFIKELTTDKNYTARLMFSILLFICEIYAVKTGNVGMHMFQNLYGEYVISIFAAICGSMAFLSLASVIYQLVYKQSLIKNTVCWYGINSLVTFPIHMTVLFLAKHLFNEWYILFIIIFVLNIPPSNFVTHYMPFMLGKGYKTNKKICQENS